MSSLRDLWGWGFPVNDDFALMVGTLLACLGLAWLLSWVGHRGASRPPPRRSD